MITEKYSLNNLILLLILLQFTSINSQNKLIKNGDTWNYYDQGYLESDWMTKTEKYTWKKGATPIGYGDKKIVTEINFGDNAEEKHIVKYFKKNITISKTKYLAYEFRTLSDDGIVIYINGKELYRLNMPNATITNKTLAVNTVSKEEEDEYKINIFEDTFFKDGENIITTSVYQAYPNSSDCIFSLELIGHTSPKMLSIILDNKNKKNSDLELKIKEFNSKFEYEKILLQKENLDSLNFNLKILFSLVSLLFILSFFGYYFIFENHKKRINDKNNALKILTSENLAKEKEMITLATNLLHNKQYFKEIKADLKGLKTEDKSTVRSMIFEIDNLLENEKEWGILKKHFDTVNDGFYSKLLKLHPNLSETELRHCMFIKLFLQTKEIARIMSIDPRSVQTSRYRIKKKMNLNEEQDLRNYLIHL
ncbi:MAG: DNA-binding CsgD family transcriptional regulator [Polaribacter sp.]|jgi:DNA-binding CsgD family transcriptional regulator